MGSKIFSIFLILFFILCYINAENITYIYDNTGRIIKVDYGNGKAIYFSYDNNGNLLKQEAAASEENHAPSIPVLLSPVDSMSNLNPTVTFQWYPSKDTDGDTIQYTLIVEGRSRILKQSEGQNSTEQYVYYGSCLVLLLFSVYSAAKYRKNPYVFPFMIAFYAMVCFSCCHSKAGREANNEGNIISETRILNNNTTYTWKVEATDGKGGKSVSETRTFSTR